MLPIVFAQASEIATVAEGLSKGGLSFICAVLGFLVWHLNKELTQAREKHLELVLLNAKDRETSGKEQLELVKETSALSHKLIDAVSIAGQISNNLTRE